MARRGSAAPSESILKLKALRLSASHRASVCTLMSIPWRSSYSESTVWPSCERIKIRIWQLLQP